MVRATSEIIGLLAGNMALSMHKMRNECVCLYLHVIIILPVFLSVHPVQ